MRIVMSVYQLRCVLIFYLIYGFYILKLVEITQIYCYNVGRNHYLLYPNNNVFAINAKYSPKHLERIKKFDEAFLQAKTALSYGDSSTLLDSFISELEDVTEEDLRMFSNKLSNMASYLFVEIDKLGDCNLLEFLANKIMNVGIQMPEIAFTALTGSYLRSGDIKKTVEWLDRLKDSGVIPKHRTFIRLFRELANNEQVNSLELMKRLFLDMEVYKVPVSPEISAFAILVLIKHWASILNVSFNDDMDSIVDKAFDEFEQGIKLILENWKSFKFSDKMLNLDTAIWISNILKLIKPPNSDDHIAKISTVKSDSDFGRCSNCPISITSNIIEPDSRYNIFTKWLQTTFKYNRAEIPSLAIFYTRLYRAHVMGRPYTYILDGANIGLHLRGKKFSYSNYQVEVIRGMLENRGSRSLIILPKAMGYPLVLLNTLGFDLDSGNQILSRLINHSNVLNNKVVNKGRRYAHEPIQWNIYKEWCNMDVIHVCEDDCYDDNYMFLASIATLSTSEALFVEKLLSETLNVKPLDSKKFDVSTYDGSDPAYVVTQDTIREFCISGVSTSDLMQWKEHSLIPYQMSRCLNPTNNITQSMTGKELLNAIQRSYDEANITNENLPSSYRPTKPKVFLGHPPKYSLHITNCDNLWHFPISLERLYFNCDSRYKSRMQFVTDVACMPFYLTTSMPELYLQKASKVQNTDWLCINLNNINIYRNQYKQLFKDNPNKVTRHLEELEIPERIRTQPFPGNSWIVASKRGLLVKDVKTNHITTQ